MTTRDMKSTRSGMVAGILCTMYKYEGKLDFMTTSELPNTTAVSFCKMFAVMLLLGIVEGLYNKYEGLFSVYL